LCWSLEVWLLWFAGVTGTGLVLFVLGLLLNRLLPRGAPSVASLAGLGSAGLFGWSILYWNVPTAEMLFVWLLPGLVIAGGVAEISWRRGWTLGWYQQRLAGLALFFFPVVPVFWINSLLWPRYPTAEVPTAERIAGIPAPSQPAPADNVYIFVFDEWPSRLTFDDDGILPAMPNLRKAAARMCRFTDAHAPGCHTATSLPRLLYQRQDRFALAGGRVGFWDGSEFRPVDDLQSIFHTARRRGYRTFMFGWYHPYHVLTGGSVDCVRWTGSYDMLGEDLGRRLGNFFWQGAIRLAGEGPANRTFGGNLILMNRQVVWQTDATLACTHALFDDPRTSGQFAVIHLFLPHFPFCYCPDGIRPLNVVHDPWSEDQARGQLGYLDQVIDRLLRRIEETGRDRNSIVILTSDHNWRHDPRMQERSAHHLSLVPLLIRFPGQTASVTIRAPFSTNHLGRLLDLFRTTDFSPQLLDDLIRSETLYHPLDESETEVRGPLVR
jgi:hypothetical protein